MGRSAAPIPWYNGFDAETNLKGKGGTWWPPPGKLMVQMHIFSPALLRTESDFCARVREYMRFEIEKKKSRRGKRTVSNPAFITINDGEHRRWNGRWRENKTYCCTAAAFEPPPVRPPAGAPYSSRNLEMCRLAFEIDGMTAHTHLVICYYFIACLYQHDISVLLGVSLGISKGISTGAAKNICPFVLRKRTTYQRETSLSFAT